MRAETESPKRKVSVVVSLLALVLLVVSFFVMGHYAIAVTSRFANSVILDWKFDILKDVSFKEMLGVVQFFVYLFLYTKYAERKIEKRNCNE